MTHIEAGIGALRLAGMKILLAEDSVDNQFLISRVLSKNGAKVEIANDGEEAIRLATASEYHVVLMDIQMPRMDGYEATRSLRSSAYSGPIIALTAHAMAEERAKTKAAGFDGHLTKPLNQAELLAAMERYLLR